MSGWGGVEHYPVVVSCFVLEDAGEAIEQGGFLGTRRDPSDVDLALDFTGEARRHGVGDTRLDLRDVRIHFVLGIDFHGPQVVHHLLRFPRQFALQDVAGRVGWVGGDEEGVAAAVGG